LTKDDRQRKVSEAALEYIVSRKEEPAMSTISSKNQITLPAHLLREMGLRSGDRLAVVREGNRLVLRARPKDWVAYHGGALAGRYGADKAETDSYLRDVRSGQDRDAEVEGAWAGQRPAAEE
jgi:AbrB family looped-hinge helix DNA binding protein